MTDHDELLKQYVLKEAPSTDTNAHAPFDYSGGGRISVSVSRIIHSPKVQKQASAVMELRKDMDAEIIKVVFPRKFPHELELVAEIKKVVYSYADDISVACALGCIEIARNEIREEQPNEEQK